MTAVIMKNLPRDPDLDNKIKSYLVEQTKIDKTLPPGVVSRVPSTPIFDRWDFSEFVPKSHPKLRKKLRKRRRKHLWKRLENQSEKVGLQFSSKPTVSNKPKSTQRSYIGQRDNASVEKHIIKYNSNKDARNPRKNTKAKQNNEKRAAHRKRFHDYYKSDLTKNKNIRNSIKTPKLMSTKYSDQLNPKIMPRDLPPGLPPDILAMIKNQQVKGVSNADSSPKPSRPRPPKPPVPGGIPSDMQELMSKASRGPAGQFYPQVNTPKKAPSLPNGLRHSPSTGALSGIAPGFRQGFSTGSSFGGGVPSGLVPGFPPHLPSGVASIGGGIHAQFPVPIEDFTWLKESLKATVDRDAVKTSLEKAVKSNRIPAVLYGAVKPRHAAGFSVQYTTNDCSELASFKGLFPTKAASACLICRAGASMSYGSGGGFSAGTSGSNAGAFSGIPSGIPQNMPSMGTSAQMGASGGMSPEIQAMIDMAAGNGRKSPKAPARPPHVPGLPPGTPGMSSAIPGHPAGVPGLPPGMPGLPNIPGNFQLPPGMLPEGFSAPRKRRWSHRLSHSRLYAAARFRRNTGGGRCVPICEIHDLRVKCTTSGTSRSLTVVGTAVVSRGHDFKKCSNKCEQEWELLLQYATTEKMRAYFSTGEPIPSGPTPNQPVPNSWQVQRVLRCGSSDLKLKDQLCFPKGNWVMQAITATRCSLGALTGLAGAGVLAIIIVFVFLFFKVCKMPKCCKKIFKGGIKLGGGPKKAGASEALGQGGAGTVEFTDEPPPPPPPP